MAEVIEEYQHDVYIVEQAWPHKNWDSRVFDGYGKFGRYNRHTFHDIRNPVKVGGYVDVGSFEPDNADVSDVPERRKGRWQDMVAFATPEAAHAYATRFAEFARPTAGWPRHNSNGEPMYVEHPLKVRVVRERESRVVELIPSPAPPTIDALALIVMRDVGIVFDNPLTRAAVVAALRMQPPKES